MRTPINLAVFYSLLNISCTKQYGIASDTEFNIYKSKNETYLENSFDLFSLGRDGIEGTIDDISKLIGVQEISVTSKINLGLLASTLGWRIGT
ncbi:MAG: hypothetical protein ABFS56_15590 [Pseudomonadota bacterium]